MKQDTALSTLLNQQQEHLTVLLLLLENELTIIGKRDVAALEQNTVRKATALDAIQAVDQQISQHPELASAKQRDDFRHCVAQLDAMLTRCKEQNEINRQAVEQSQLVIERYKHELLNQRGKSGLTYNAKGKPSLDSVGKGIKA
ncbi:MAG TPA: flagellar biosynthesis protein FlgN [Rheinheimera sp.]|nr:flagellar biosynthesis protein FlgN [Rheinheimera sp.]